MAMKTAYIFMFSVVAICHSQAQLVCLSGQRTTNSSGVFNNWQGQICNDTTQKCRNSVYNLGAGAFWEFGSCVTPATPTPTCQQTATDFQVSTYDTCDTSQCNTFTCNNWILPAGCSATPPTDDIQILPGCTLKEAFAVDQCLNSFVKGLPYSDGTATCKVHINNGMTCGITLLNKCLGQHCPSILDSIPFALSSQYPMVLQYAANFNNIDAIFSLIPNLSDTLKEQILQAVCLNNNAVLLQNLTDLINTVNLNLTLGEPVCDNNILNDLIKWSIDALPKILAASSHDELCTEVDAILIQVKNAWQTRCSKTAALLLIKGLIPGPYTPLYDDIETAFNIVESYLLSFQLPGCTDATTVAMTTTSSAVNLHREIVYSFYAGVLSVASALVL